MRADKTCNATALQVSQDMIRTILDDITENYEHVSGGGISEIKQTVTNTFVVSIPQEERIDRITYELEINDHCDIAIKRRKLDAITPWAE